MSRRFIPLSGLIVLSLVFALALSFVSLPDWIAFARPALLPMVTLFWVTAMPLRFNLTAGWCLGLLMDVMYGTVLGEHALALVIACFIVARFSDLIRSYRYLLQMLFLLPVFLVYEFVLFWIDGLTGHSADPLWRWAPVASSVLCWPLLSYFLRRLLRYAYGT
jgi:rod shape-determining protein MreD